MTNQIIRFEFCALIMSVLLSVIGGFFFITSARENLYNQTIISLGFMVLGATFTGICILYLALNPKPDAIQ